MIFDAALFLQVFVTGSCRPLRETRSRVQTKAQSIMTSVDIMAMDQTMSEREIW